MCYAGNPALELAKARIFYSHQLQIDFASSTFNLQAKTNILKTDYFTFLKISPEMYEALLVFFLFSGLLFFISGSSPPGGYKSNLKLLHKH